VFAYLCPAGLQYYSNSTVESKGKNESDHAGTIYPGALQ